MSKEIELAWAAGLFDGEGSINGGIRTCKTSKLGFSTHQKMSIGQNDREVLDRFLAAVENGFIYGPYVYKTNGNEYYQWQCSDRQNVIKIYELLWPNLGSRKKEQAKRILSELNDWGPNLNENT